jgi:hypothetical protein
LFTHFSRLRSRFRALPTTSPRVAIRAVGIVMTWGRLLVPSEGLYPALLAVKEEVKTLPKDAINPHFRSKYTPLDTIVETVEPLLTKNGLVWITKPVRDEHGDPALAYKLVHAESKEFEEGEMPLLLTKNDPQGQGSAITYARRYALCSVLNLVADDDDDGNSASGGQTQTSRPSKPPSEKQAGFLQTLVKQKIKDTRQLEQMVREAGADTEISEGWVQRLSDRQCSTLIERLKNGEIPAPPEPVLVPASDVPSDADEFVHPAQPSLEEEIEAGRIQTESA